MMTKEEELRLIQRVLAGDKNAYEPLVLEHQTKVYNLALRILGNETDAWDAAQEALLRAYTSLADFRGESRFGVWLYRLTNNICIDMLRKQKRRPAVSLDAMENEDGESERLEIPDERFSPQEELEKKELRAAVSRAMAQLPEEYRQILALREISGLSYEELAEALKLETGTVKSRLNRARKKLCALLLRDGNFSMPESSNKGKGGVKDV